MVYLVVAWRCRLLVPLWCRHGPYVGVLQDEGVNWRGRPFEVEIGEHVNSN